jgi:hypothetical protein
MSKSDEIWVMGDLTCCFKKISTFAELFLAYLYLLLVRRVQNE